MNRHERWVLEAACTLKQPIRALTSANLEEWFNGPHHGLDPLPIVAVLRQLLRKDHIVLSGGHEGDLRENEEELRRLIEGDDSGPPSRTTYYGLTASGGAAWEEAARPDWNRYVDASSGTDPDEGEAICADLARVDGYVFSPYQDQRPIPDSVRRDRLAPWQATYWKTLPLGHRIRFLYDPTERAQLESGSDFWAKRRAWLEDVNDWFQRG